MQALLEDKEKAWEVQLRAEKQEVRRLRAILETGEGGHSHSSPRASRTSTAQTSGSTFGRWRNT